jgi:hypothetical protein
MIRGSDIASRIAAAEAAAEAEASRNARNAENLLELFSKRYPEMKLSYSQWQRLKEEVIGWLRKSESDVPLP